MRRPGGVTLRPATPAPERPVLAMKPVFVLQLRFLHPLERMGAVGAIHELPLHTWRKPSLGCTGENKEFQT